MIESGDGRLETFAKSGVPTIIFKRINALNKTKDDKKIGIEKGHMSKR